MLRLKNLYLAVFCVLVVLCRATSAKADALDYTLMSSGNTISFQLPSQTPTPTGCTLVFGCNGSFGFINLPVTFNGSTFSNGEVDFSDTTFGGGIVIQTAGNWLVNLVLPGFAQLYNGSLTNPTMLIGNFDLTTASCPGCPATELAGAFSLNVMTPEPSILLMLSIGILGLAGLSVKKFCAS